MQKFIHKSKFQENLPYDLKHLAISPYLEAFNWKTMNILKNNLYKYIYIYIYIFKTVFEPNAFSNKKNHCINKRPCVVTYNNLYYFYVTPNFLHIKNHVSQKIDRQNQICYYTTKLSKISKNIFKKLNYKSNIYFIHKYTSFYTLHYTLK